MAERKSIKELFNLEGKTAVVTGGLGHLGEAMTETLLELGAQVVVTGPGAPEREMPKGKVSFEQLDFKKEGAIKAFFQGLEKLDILVNNAVYTNPENFEEGVEGVLSSVYECCKGAFPHMEKQKKGVIINIASMYGMVAPDWRIYEAYPPSNSPPNYGAAKAGVLQLTRYLASYWAPYGIRVNAISPGPFSHPGRPEEFLKRLREKTMLDRIGVPEDLKGTVALLASDASSYITGQNIVVDGGWTAW